jgi:hypothetical protein
MRIKVAVMAVTGIMVLSAAAAEAHVIPFGLAKREIRRTTADVCAETSGCISWRVGPCRRQSAHRVDCLSQLHGESGATCSFVTIGRAPPGRYEVIVQHKRVVCH